MKASVMDVLLYIFEHFQEEEFIPESNAQQLIDELKGAGFESIEINSALNWLDGLVDADSTQILSETKSQSSIRIYHPYEQQILSIEAQDFLYFLEKVNVLDVHSREAVIDRVLALDSDDQVSLEQLKWVVMMVLFNLPGKLEAAEWLENIDSHFH